MKNIALVGFMGTGKSTIAALLAKELQAEYIDLDGKIEEKEGMDIVDIFSQKRRTLFSQSRKRYCRENFPR